MFRGTDPDNARPSVADDSDILTLTPGEADPRSAARLKEWTDTVIRRFGRASDDPALREPAALPPEVGVFIASADSDALCDLIAAALAALDAMV